jgi:hypothetical protein
LFFAFCFVADSSILQVFRALARSISLLPAAWTFGAEAAADQFKEHLLVSIFCFRFSLSSQTLQSQLDLTIEHANIKRFRENFCDDPVVVFPAVFDGLCSKTCMLQTLEEGEPLKEFLARVDRATSADALSSLTFRHPHSDSLNLPQQPSSSQLLDRMSAADVVKLSRELGFVGARAFIKMLVQHNFVHVSSGIICLQKMTSRHFFFHQSQLMKCFYRRTCTQAIWPCAWSSTKGVSATN